MGGQWGGAADDKQAYFSVNGTSGKTPGGIRAVRIDTGAEVWSKEASEKLCGTERGCSQAQGAAVSALPGIVLSGSMDGGLRAYAADDGTLVWSFDTNKEFETVNGVKAKGGAMDGPGAAGGQRDDLHQLGLCQPDWAAGKCAARIRSRLMNGTVAVAVEPRAGRGAAAILSLAAMGALVFIGVAALPYLLRMDEAQFKQYWPMRGWLLAHITMGMVAILTGPVQLWLGLSDRFPALHKNLGFVYMAAVTLGAVAAYYLAFKHVGRRGVRLGPRGARHRVARDDRDGVPGHQAALVRAAQRMDDPQLRRDVRLRHVPGVGHGSRGSRRAAARSHRHCGVVLLGGAVAGE
jgi:hypothetical protein